MPEKTGFPCLCVTQLGALQFRYQCGDQRRIRSEEQVADPPGARANAAQARVRSAIEHVFVRQKRCMALFVRTIGLARARVKIGLRTWLAILSGLRGSTPACPCVAGIARRQNCPRRSARTARMDAGG